MINIKPQFVYTDTNDRILGVTSPERGIEVFTEYNCSMALTDDFIPLYKIENGSSVILRDAAEIEADRASQELPQASWNDRIEAQVTYTAMMTDTLIEEV